MDLGKILIILGIISIIPISVQLTTQTGMATISATPDMPIGIGGTATYNQTFLPDGIIVSARNIRTGIVVNRSIENGLFAIPISAKTGDKIEVTTTYYNITATKIIKANLRQHTHWCNLTVGEDDEKVETIDWWLTIIPTGLIAVGVVYGKKF